MESYRELKDIGNELLPLRLYHIKSDKYRGLELQFFSGFGTEIVNEIYLSKCIIPHWHSYFEIILVLEGTAEIQLNSDYFHASTGELVLVDVYDIHNVAGQCRYMVINIDPAQIPHIRSSFKEVFPKTTEAKRIKSDIEEKAPQVVKACIFDIFSLYKEKPFGYMLLVMGKIYEMLGSIHGYAASLNSNSLPVSQTRKEDLTRLNNIVEYIRNNYTRDIELEDIAKEVGFTPTYFCRFFKRAMGKTFFEYLNYYRCSKAEILINTTSMTITEIAMETGFSSLSYFDKVYKKHKGCRPSEEKSRATGR
ncbi:MAG: AraC family transcriptional regulator [Bacillota bacterium]